MISRIKFYNSQGIFNLKRSLLLIIGFGLALSAIAGISFVGDSYSTQLQNDAKKQQIDFAILIPPMFSVSDDVLGNISAEIKRNTQISYSLYSQFSMDRFQDIYMFQNYTQFPAEIRPINYNYVMNKFSYYLFDYNFYQSDFAAQLFKHLNGTFPDSENEILVDYGLAKAMNLTIGPLNSLNLIGQTNDFQWLSDSVEINQTSFNASITNLTISGIYLLEEPILDFYIMNYSTNYIYDGKTNDLQLKNKYNLDIPILGYHNYSNSYVDNPLKRFDLDYSIYFLSDKHYTGFLGAVDRNKWQVSKFKAEITKLSDNFLYISQNIPSYTTFRERLINEMENLYSYITRTNLQLQIINIPLVIFTLVLGSYTIKSNFKSRLEEIMLLKSKGTPNRMIIFQIIIESLYIGISSAFLGILGGISLFYLFRNVVQIAYELPVIFMNLTITIRYTSILIIFAVSVIAAEIASLSSMFYARKISNRDLLKYIEKDKLDIFYDEQVLFTNKKSSQKIHISDTPFIKSNNSENQKSIGKKRIVVQKIVNLFRRSLYKDDKNEEKTRIKYRGWISVALSLIPIILLGIFIYITNFPTSDYLVSLIPLFDIIFQRLYPILLILVVLFGVGLTRIISIEHPNFFVKIVDIISKKFLGYKSKLAAINILRRKPYAIIMTIFGIFITTFAFTNIYLQSISTYEKIQSNVSIGGDIQFELKQIHYVADPMGYYGLVDNYKINTNFDVSSLEEEVKNITLDSGSKLVNDVVTVFKEITNYYSVSVYFFNFSKYLNIITEENKFIPDKSIIGKFQSVIQYNLNKTGQIPGILVNSGFLKLNRLSINDNFQIDHTYYNHTDRKLYDRVLEGKILNTIEISPGIHGFNREIMDWDKAVAYFDINQFFNMSSKEILDGFKIYQIADSISVPLKKFDVLGLSEKQILLTKFQSVSLFNDRWKDKSDLTPEFQGMKKVLSIELFSISGIVAITFAIIMVYVIKRDSKLNGVLLSRGMGKISVYNLILWEFLIIFLLPILICLFQLIVFTKPLLMILNESFQIYPISWRLQIFFDFGEILRMFIIVPVVSITIFTIIFTSQTKRSISSFFKQF